jgi:hypothetical protein
MSVREILFFAIIERFYEKYIRYVKGPLDDAENCLPPCHWERYFELVSAGKPLQRLTDFLDVVNAGAYAHTRFDLAEAIAETLKDRADIVASPKALETLRRDLIGRPTNDVFGRASSGFFTSILERATGTFPRGVGVISALNVGVIQVVWMRKFQLWRALAWEDALASLGGPDRVLQQARC